MIQIIDCLVMQSMSWLRTYLNGLVDKGHTIDSVVISDGEVIIVHRQTSNICR